MKEAPICGSVLGVDVGWSSTRRSSAVCRLTWNQSEVSWSIMRFRAVAAERDYAIRSIAGDHQLMCVALDGPMRRGFDIIGSYRLAEQILTRRFQQKIGKPGQSNSPVGKTLNAATNILADAVKKLCRIDEASHCDFVDALAIVEAFPTAFLGIMVENPTSIIASRGNRSDEFYRYLARSRMTDHLISRLLPGRHLSLGFEDVINHDDRAGLVCALTALCVVRENFTSVGDDNGRIILPPREMIQPWAWDDLAANSLGLRDALKFYE